MQNLASLMRAPNQKPARGRRLRLVQGSKGETQALLRSEDRFPFLDRLDDLDVLDVVAVHFQKRTYAGDRGSTAASSL
jgi:hypothetical protein